MSRGQYVLHRIWTLESEPLHRSLVINALVVFVHENVAKIDKRKLNSLPDLADVSLPSRRSDKYCDRQTIRVDAAQPANDIVDLTRWKHLSHGGDLRRL